MPEDSPPFWSASAAVPAPLLTLVLAGLAALLLPATGSAQSPNIQIWQKTIKHAPPSRPGCFEVAYPDIQWQQVACTPLENRSRTSFPPLPPPAATKQAAKNNNNPAYYTATVQGKGISFAEGTFLDVTGINHIYSEDSQGSNPQDNLFSLRLDTNFFPVADSGLCTSSGCQGSVQFLYDNDAPQGEVYIRYWIQGVASCPASWQSVLPTGCYKSTPLRASVPGLTADNVGDAALSGQTSRGLDVAILSVGGKAYAQVNKSIFRKLPQAWRQARFDMAGRDTHYAILNVNPGASLTVRTTVNNGTTTAPVCSSGGIASGDPGQPDKSGNLRFNSPCCPYGGAEPSIAFVQGTATGSTATCAALGSNTIVPAAGAHGAISPTASVNVPDGAVSLFTVTPASGYNIASVTGCGGTLSGNVFTTAPASASCAIAATFAPEPYPSVTTGVNAGGIIAPSGYFTVDAGTAAAFAITPDASHIIAAVDGTCDGALSGNIYTTQAITDDCTVKVTFAQQINIITASAGVGGIIHPAGYSAATSGTVRTFTIVPYSRYAIASVGGTCGGTLNGNTYTTRPITGSCTITPLFTPAPLPHTVSPTATGNAGSIVINSWRPITVSPGSTASFRFTAKQGYIPTATLNTCGTGSMSGAWPHYTYTTGPVTANCSVRFTAAQQMS